MPDNGEGLRLTDRGRLAVVIMRAGSLSLDEAETIINAIFAEKDGAALSGELLRKWDSPECDHPNTVDITTTSDRRFKDLCTKCGAVIEGEPR